MGSLWHICPRFDLRAWGVFSGQPHACAQHACALRPCALGITASKTTRPSIALCTKWAGACFTRACVVGGRKLHGGDRQLLLLSHIRCSVWQSLGCSPGSCSSQLALVVLNLPNSCLMQLWAWRELSLKLPRGNSGLFWNDWGQRRAASPGKPQRFVRGCICGGDASVRGWLPHHGCPRSVEQQKAPRQASREYCGYCRGNWWHHTLTCAAPHDNAYPLRQRLGQLASLRGEMAPLTGPYSDMESFLESVQQLPRLPVDGWSLFHVRLDNLERGTPKSMVLALEIAQAMHTKPHGGKGGGVLVVVETKASLYLCLATQSRSTAVLLTPAVFKSRPFNFAAALDPALAAVALNKLCVGRHDVLLDPCCGTGTVLVGGIERGAQVIGCDQSFKFAVGSRANLDYFGFASVGGGALRSRTGWDGACAVAHHDARQVSRDERGCCAALSVPTLATVVLDELCVWGREVLPPALLPDPSSLLPFSLSLWNPPILSPCLCDCERCIRMVVISFSTKAWL